MSMRSLWSAVTLILVAVLSLTVAPSDVSAQAREEPPADNVFTGELDVQMGRRVFQQQCGRCHGEDGTGGEGGPDLTNGFRSASTDEGLFKIVREGIPNTQMVGISRRSTDQSAWMVVAYLNSLNDTNEVALPGTAANGQQLFAGKGNCSGCHMVNGEGGRRGPELSQVGNRRDPAELVSDLRTPDQDVAPRWWTLRVTRPDGSVVQGLRMDEDTFSMRLMDDDENLWSFSKRDVRSYDRIKTSTMPSVNATLTDAEVDDLVAYLFSLRREEN